MLELKDVPVSDGG